MKRTGLLLVAAAVVAIVAAAFLLYSSLDSIVAKAIERHGSALTGTKVAVDSVEISARSGRGSILGLRIANPPGFAPGDAIRVGAIHVQLDVASLAADPVVIEELQMGTPLVNYRIGATGASNIDVIREHVAGQPSGADSPESPGRGEPTTRIAIRRFTSEKGRIHFDASVVGLAPANVDLASLRLTDVGGLDGATPEELGKAVMAAFGQSITGTLAGRDLRRYIDRKLSGAAGEAAKKLLDRLLD